MASEFERLYKKKNGEAWEKILDGMEPRPWPNTTREVRDDAARKRRVRAAWMGLLAAATQLDSKWPNERGFAHKEIRRLAKVLTDFGVTDAPTEGGDVEAGE